MNIFVGNLKFRATVDQLRDLFSQAGTVTSVRVVMGENGQSKGFGFVEMNDADGVLAIAKFHGFKWMGRQLEVSVARTKAVRRRGRE